LIAEVVSNILKEDNWCSQEMRENTPLTIFLHSCKVPFLTPGRNLELHRCGMALAYKAIEAGFEDDNKNLPDSKISKTLHLLLKSLSYRPCLIPE
jgi:hypothetical protein